MSPFAGYRPCANLTQQDYRTLILSSDSGAKWIRGYESYVPSLRGETAAPAILSTPNRLDSRCARKLAGLLNTPPPRPTLDYTPRGRHLRYLIGQQRSQSIPHDVSKSSA